MDRWKDLGSTEFLKDALSDAGLLASPNGALSINQSQVLARKFGDEVGRWLSLQQELRGRARSKFDHPEELIFTRDGLEMATHSRIAKMNAARFSGCSQVIDTSAGIGGDAIGIARETGLPVQAFETDPNRSFCLKWNLGQFGSQITVHEAEFSSAQMAQLAGERMRLGIWIDPMRRTEGSGGRRRVMVGQYTPGFDECLEWSRFGAVVGIKLSPGDDPEIWISAGFEVEAVSLGRECRQLTAWKGANLGKNLSAIHVETGSRLPSCEPPSRIEHPLSYLYDVDPAVTQARATGNFGFPSLGDSVGYLTSDTKLNSEWLRRYAVIDVIRPDPKALAAALRKVDGAIFELKQRGTNFDFKRDFSRFRAEKGSSSQLLSLICYRVGKKTCWCLAK